MQISSLTVPSQQELMEFYHLYHHLLSRNSRSKHFVQFCGFFCTLELIFQHHRLVGSSGPDIYVSTFRQLLYLSIFSDTFSYETCCDN